MRKTIWKFEVPQKSKFQLQMPAGAKILSLQAQGGIGQIWAMVDPDAQLETRAFHQYGTGHEIKDAEALTFLGTYQMESGNLVFHVFEVAL